MELNSKNIKKILLIVFLSSVIVASVFNLDGVIAFFSKIFSFISPVILALCVAFVLNVPLRALENKVFKFMDKNRHKFMRKLRRPICMVFTYLLALGIISLLVLVIIPDIIDTVIYIVDKLPSFVVTASEWLVTTFTKFGFAPEDIPLLKFDFSSFATTVKDFLSSYSGKIVGDAVTITTSVIGGVFDTVFCLVISAYILAQKEKIGRFVKNVIDTFVPQKTASAVYHIANQASDSFSRFIGGQITV